MSAGPDGALYRLEGARFRVRGPSDVDFNTDDFPAESVHSFQLPPGDYEVTLRNGWTLVRTAGDAHDGPVAATLVSTNPMALRVDSGAVVGVRFVFQVDDVNVIFEPGQLDVGVDVVFPDAGMPTVTACVADEDCESGRFCQGVPHCDPTDTTADLRGCVEGSNPCAPTEVCDEVQDVCLQPLACMAPTRVCASDADCGANSNPCDGENTCDPTSPLADQNGCVATPGCSSESCDPGIGCRVCSNNAGCSYCAGEVCDPGHPAANLAGCVVAPGRTPNEECTSRAGFCWEGPRTCRGYPEAPARCHNDLDCGGFCSGNRCEPTNLAADLRGCIGGGPNYTAICATLNSGPHCIESERRCGNCATTGPDARLADQDGDGYASVACGGGDCDDTDARRHPIAMDTCNDGLDEDCNVETFGTTDQDGDGHVSSACRNEIRSGPRGAIVTITQGDDCDDQLAGVHPSATEVCNHRDDDCDGMVDEGVAAPLYRDLDGDGYGDATCTFSGCWNDPGYVTNPFDCDDTNPALTPGTGVCLDATRIGFCSQGSIVPVSCQGAERCRTGVDGVGRCQ